MNPISPLSRPNGPGLNQAGRPSPQEASTRSAVRKSDRVEFSDAARLLNRLSQLPDVRQDLIDRVRSEIASGTYESPEKIDAVVQSLAEEFAQ